jgi:hypothetical protein
LLFRNAFEAELNDLSDAWGCGHGGVSLKTLDFNLEVQHR